MRMFAKTLGLMVILLGSPASAAEQAVDAVGYGANRTQAIADALVQGLRQATGVSVESREVMQSISGRQSISEGDEATHTSSFEVARQGDLKLTTGGVVSRYDVHEVVQEADGSYRADITLHVVKYDKPGLPADSRRSLGLGLALCKSITSAHGSDLTLTDNKPQGCIFTFSLPAGEVNLHE